MTFPSEVPIGHGVDTMPTSVCDLSDTYRSYFRIGGFEVELRGIPDINPSLERFQVVSPCAPDIYIQAGWTNSIQHEAGNPLFDSGSLWRLFDDDQGLRFDFSVPILGERPYRRLRIDDKYRYATIELSGEYLGQGWRPDPMEYPLDELLIMHRLTQERAIELHGVGIVGPNGASNLFVGHSGAGKSTTARLWTSLHKVEILSDDRIIVRESPARELQPGDDPRQIFMYGTPWHGEGCFALPQRAPLQRIFVLEHGHGNVLTHLSRSQMVAELFARSFVPFHRHEYVESALSFLEQLADSVPCYRYSFEPDQRAVDKILHFHD
jgi:hypothetical protein